MSRKQETAIKPQKTLDATGLYCPEPVMMLHGIMDEIEEGEVVYVIATDPSTERDIPKFCEFLGHTLHKTQAGENFEFWIIKGQP